MFSDAGRRGDFDAMGNLLAPDFVVVDHQILGFGEGDRDYLIEVGRTRTQGAVDGTRMVLSLRTARNALLSVTVSPSITDQGSEYERLECVLAYAGCAAGALVHHRGGHQGEQRGTAHHGRDRNVPERHEGEDVRQLRRR